MMSWSIVVYVGRQLHDGHLELLVWESEVNHEVDWQFDSS